ncbi:YlbG family protein [Streptococcus halichoeri]|uniref:YlbG family protein n=1 Tax=Streptococcus halichoeri TaxID=254785 RepID=UPI00135C71FC|nr:YlbG family protein [Streptococcus halichoeri]
MYQKQERQGLVVYLYYNRDARKVMKYGDLHYHSKRSRYLYLYVNQSEVAQKIEELSKLRFVKKVKPSELAAIDTHFVGNLHRQEDESGATAY